MSALFVLDNMLDNILAIMGGKYGYLNMLDYIGVIWWLKPQLQYAEKTCKNELFFSIKLAETP
jgi:hypothetical protein